MGFIAKRSSPGDRSGLWATDCCLEVRSGSRVLHTSRVLSASPDLDKFRGFLGNEVRDKIRVEETSTFTTPRFICDNGLALFPGIFSLVT